MDMPYSQELGFEFTLKDVAEVDKMAKGEK